MRLDLQWTLAAPQEQFSLELNTQGAAANRWRQLPKRAAQPGVLGGQDNTPGHLMWVCVQGVDFHGFDAYSAEPFVGGIRVLAWNYQSNDWPTGTRYGVVYEFRDPAPDSRIGGGMNTRQRATLYAEPQADVLPKLQSAETTDGPWTIRPWSEFPTPAAQATVFGVWVTEPLLLAHKAKRRPVSWREWVV